MSELLYKQDCTGTLSVSEREALNGYLGLLLDSFLDAVAAGDQAALKPASELVALRERLSREDLV